MSRRATVPVVLLSVVVGLALMPWRVASHGLRDHVARAMLERGVVLRMSGDTTLALLPFPRLTLGGVRLATSDGTVLVDGTRLRTELRLFPLVAGRIELASLSLTGGTITVAVGADGVTSWDAIVERASARLTEAKEPVGFLQRVALARMTLRVEHPDGRTPTRLDNLDLAARWPGVDAALSATASATWQGETLRASVSDIRPGQLAQRAPSPVSLAVTSRLGEANIGGEFSLGREPRLNGHVSGTAASLARLAGWAGLTGVVPGRPDAVSVSGEIALAKGELSLPRTQITLAGQRLDGTVTVRHDTPRPAIRATLAGDRLDLSELAGWRSTDWRTSPVDFGALQRADLDLRLSALKVVVDGLAFSDIAAGVLTGPNRVEVSLGRATIGGGTVKGRLSVLGTPAHYDVKVHTTFDRVEIGNMLVEMGRPRELTGSSQGVATLESAGSTPDEMLRSLSGRFGMSIKDGDFESRLGAALRTGDPSGAGGFGNRTPFQDMAVSLVLTNGVADVAEGAVGGESVRAAASGQLSLVDGSVDLRIETGPPGRHLASATARPGAPGTAFSITGPWDWPAIRMLAGPARAPGD